MELGKPVGAPSPNPVHSSWNPAPRVSGTLLVPVLGPSFPGAREPAEPSFCGYRPHLTSSPWTGGAVRQHWGGGSLGGTLGGQPRGGSPTVNILPLTQPDLPDPNPDRRALPSMSPRTASSCCLGNRLHWPEPPNWAPGKSPGCGLDRPSRDDRGFGTERAGLGQEMGVPPGNPEPEEPRRHPPGHIHQPASLQARGHGGPVSLFLRGDWAQV